MSDWESVIKKEWKRRSDNRPRRDDFFPLIAQSFDDHEIVAVVDTLLSGQLTMAKKVREFEEAFAKRLGVPYAVMVNSGSSANLLAMAAAANPLRQKFLKKGDHVLVPAVCWSTSVWPILQLGLVPVLVDIDPHTLNIDLKELKKKISPQTKGILAVHILGNSAPMEPFLEICRENKLLIIEDTCESLGSQSHGKFLGTLGEFGTFSFYYSHHITTGEGGMVTCHTLEDYDLLKCLRAHGWSRELSNRKQLEEKFNDVDPRFLFVNVGYNFRPMEVQAAFGLLQLERLGEMNRHRNANRQNLMASLKEHRAWKDQFEFIQTPDGTDPAWFGFPCLMSKKYEKKHRAFLAYLSESGVENRPIVSGNFARQPGLKLHGIHCRPQDFPGAELITERGFFIGLHTEALETKTLSRLTDILLGFNFDGP